LIGQVKGYGMGRECSRHGIHQEFTQDFGEENHKERDHKEYLDVDGRIILKKILQK
jgi:hypothetical protein